VPPKAYSRVATEEETADGEEDWGKGGVAPTRTQWTELTLADANPVPWPRLPSPSGQGRPQIRPMSRPWWGSGGGVTRRDGEGRGEDSDGREGERRSRASGSGERESRAWESRAWGWAQD